MSYMVIKLVLRKNPVGIISFERPFGNHNKHQKE